MTLQQKTLAKSAFALVGAAAVALFWCYDFMAARRDAARAAQADLLDATQAAERIASFSRQPAFAAEHERLASETTRLIEQAAGAAGISPDQLIRIAPEPPQRLGESAYKEKPTQVTLKNITLEQLVKLVHRLVSGDAGLHAKTLRITSLGQEVSASLWGADIVLTYLIYEPRHSEK